MRAFFDAYAERQGKPRWGDKTPAYMLSVTRIGRALPEARFVHLIRDGRDVALSQTARAINEQPPPAEQAAKWVKRIGKSREQAAKLGGERYIEARYEDLVRDPEPTLRRICDFVALDFDPAMLTYYERAADRLAEMSGALRAEGRPRRAGRRLPRRQPQADDPAARSEQARQVAPRDEPGGSGCLRGGRRRDAGRARLRAERGVV